MRILLDMDAGMTPSHSLRCRSTALINRLFRGDNMKLSSIVLALSVAGIAGVASAETGVKINHNDSVANVYGRASAANVQIAGTVVTRTAEEVVPGPTTEEGPTAVAVGTRTLDVNEAQGRS